MKTLVILPCLATICLTLDSVALAAVSQPSRYKIAVDECRSLVNLWNREGNIEIILVIAVICFGAFITCIQGFNASWAKPATLALGASVTIITGINARALPDYRLLEQSAIDGGELVENLANIADAMEKPGADVQGLTTQWITTKTQFNQLRKRVAEVGTSDATNKNSQSSVLGILPIVYAQSSLPSWIYSHPTSDTDKNLYCVGQGENTLINAARQVAFDNAVGTCASTLPPGSDGPTARAIIASSAIIEKDTFVWSSEKTAYTYFILLRVSSDIKHIGSVTARDSNTQVIEVSATTRWTDTGIQLKLGDNIAIKASGTINWNKSKVVNADGSLDKFMAKPMRPLYPTSTIGVGGLIGRVGKGETFKVGQNLKFTSSSNGNLILGINDNSYNDNSGKFTVSISVVHSH